MTEQGNARRMMQAAFDALSFGIILVDSACRPLLMDCKAEACLGAGLGLLGEKSHLPLRAGKSTETQTLHRLAHEAAAARLASPPA